MRFAPTEEQTGFARSLDSLLAGADTPGVNRAWAAGDHEPGRLLWKRLAAQGVTSLADPGSGATPVDLVVAFEQLGRHAVPGPWVESAYVATALGRDLGESMATVAVAPHVPYLLDADVADEVHGGTAGERVESVDPTRRLFRVEAGGFEARFARTSTTGETARALDVAVLAVSAQLLGLGEHLLETTVDYAKQRWQFGRAIGSYQTVKHALADVRIGLDLARPLLWGAALDDVPPSAAKISCGDAAYRAMRTALQVHGAIGYTTELDLSWWLLRVRALQSVWGTAGWHRARLLEGLVPR